MKNSQIQTFTVATWSMNLKEISTTWIFAELHINNYSSNLEHELKQLSLNHYSSNKFRDYMDRGKKALEGTVLHGNNVLHGNKDTHFTWQKKKH
jgi:hypothetical protein